MKAPLLGFDGTSLMKACCGVGGLYNFNTSQMCGLPGVPVCPNPAQRIHWDGIHLTQEAYMHMSQWLLSDLLPKMQLCIVDEYYGEIFCPVHLNVDEWIKGTFYMYGLLRFATLPK
ncbi:hypothetical protein IFM89_037179 [Coptis chinensis]|uniref:Uncharacterized protein n=1 Tax=Coptis chinensis TaxID=261450 RepID=A0A835I7S6_9MAGN|nr:hypothetical protein IFM89_037179 [Coptis chinensis]